MINQVMHVGVAADHGGFGLEQDLWSRVRMIDYEVVDSGVTAQDIVDENPDSVIRWAKLRRVAASRSRQRRGSIGLGEQDRRQARWIISWRPMRTRISPRTGWVAGTMAGREAGRTAPVLAASR